MILITHGPNILEFFGLFVGILILFGLVLFVTGLFMGDIKIKFHYHKYNNWETIKEGPFYSSKVIDVEKDIPIGIYIEQKRTCIKCGYKELRKETSA